MLFVSPCCADGLEDLLDSQGNGGIVAGRDEVDFLAIQCRAEQLGAHAEREGPGLDPFGRVVRVGLAGGDDVYLRARSTQRAEELGATDATREVLGGVAARFHGRLEFSGCHTSGDSQDAVPIAGFDYREVVERSDNESRGIVNERNCGFAVLNRSGAEHEFGIRFAYPHAQLAKRHERKFTANGELSELATRRLDRYHDLLAGHKIWVVENRDQATILHGCQNI